MSHGSVELPFGNGIHEFNVARHKQLFELQDRCGLKATGPDGETIHIPSGPLEIFNRLRGGSWRHADVIEPIRLGLVGAGRELREVAALLKEFVEDQPLGPLAPVAMRIMFACVYGVQGDDLGKAAAEGTASEVGDSASSAPPNTEQAPL